MDYDQLFSFCNGIAFLTWLLAMIAPFWKWTPKLMVGGTVTILAVLYAFFVFQTFDAEMLEHFGSLDGLLILFSDRGAVLVGWIHYLAFDLMVGYFIISNAKKNGINRWVLIPCLLFTFMLGPVGFLLYLFIRFVKTKVYFLEE